LFTESKEIRIRLDDGDIIARFDRSKVQHFHSQYLTPGTKLKLYGRISTREIFLGELCQNDELKEIIQTNQKTFVYCLDVKKFTLVDGNTSTQTQNKDL
jgi:hypothetical protein